jgi:hypothetical protein
LMRLLGSFFPFESLRLGFRIQVEENPRWTGLKQNSTWFLLRQFHILTV